MRIGILTFHNAVNYGAYLQAFSLLNKLQVSFPNDEVEIIDYTAPKEALRKPYVILRSVKYQGIAGMISEIRRVRIFRKMQRYLSRSPKRFCTRDRKKLFHYIEQRYDMLIIGSDAVFNWNQTKYPSAYIPDYDFTIPVYTYAASVHGLRYYEIDEQVRRKCGESFRKMTWIGTRDACTERFVQYCEPDAKTGHCCDPTMFIDQDVLWKLGHGIVERAERVYRVSLDEPYIVIMAPDSAVTEYIGKRYGKDYKIVSVFVKSSFADVYLDDLNPFEWAVVLRKASLVVTSYFHGTLLGLVQGTPVLTLDHSGYCDYESKLKDLMVNRLSLAELYMSQNLMTGVHENDAFVEIIDNLLRGVYQDRIADAIKKERVYVEPFVERIALRSKTVSENLKENI